jgi:polyhydroxybutyrate depolymerase
VSDEVVHFSWSGCDASTDFYVIENGGHTWPGSIEVPGLGHVTSDISATEIIWEAFFD